MSIDEELCDLLDSLVSANSDSMAGISSTEFSKWWDKWKLKNPSIDETISDRDISLMHIAFSEGFCVAMTKKLGGEL